LLSLTVSMKAKPILTTALFIILLLPALANAQVRSESEKKHRSFYLSIGTSTSVSMQSSLHIDQAKYKNSYDLLKLPYDKQVFAKLSFPLNANWHLGYFFDCNQRTGVELNITPVKFHITDSGNVHLKGRVENTNVDKTIAFSTVNGNYYYLNGDLGMISFIKRFPIMHPRLNRVCFDAILKIGAGPVLTRTYSSLDSNAFADKLKLTGWNAGFEAAFRSTHWRHFFVELAAKYDYASLSGITVNNGTAKQNLSAIFIIGSVGVSLPLNHDTKVMYYNYGPEHL
jgi:hypothetical protein